MHFIGNGKIEAELYDLGEFQEQLKNGEITSMAKLMKLKISTKSSAC